MNRLIIIGNGFDLAHKLPTSYRNFIDDFWRNFKHKCKTDLYKELVYTHDSFDGYYNYYKSIEKFDDLKSNIFEYCKEYPDCHFEEKISTFYTSRLSNKEIIFEFKNDFFKQINGKNSEKWVDIENEYYRLLKRYTLPLPSNDTDKKENKKKVEKLNQEFEQIKKLLENYLTEKVENVYNFKMNWNELSEFYHLFFPELMSEREEQRNNYIEHFSKNDRKEIEEYISVSRLNTKLHFLCFNYTETLNPYLYHLKNKLGQSNVEVNFIHGILNNQADNKINFGFGDEMDDDYKAIENFDDNEYLKNFKSFQYSQNSNYKNLLDFIDSEKFEVLTFGHSCGLSDRTLLNTVFEHKNCRLIKPFFYEHKDKDGKVLGDNYTEIIQNISRHFNKKALMRSKIVNKTLCRPIPQLQLSKNK